MGRKCTGHKPDGTPCGAWAKRDSVEPLCAAHQTQAKVGAPKGNKNAEKHGAYSADPERDPSDLQVRIDDLAAKIDRLSHYIDLNFDDLEPGDIKGLMALHGQLTSRLGRLERDLKATRGDAASAGQSKVERIMEEALTLFWAEMEEKSGT